MPALHLVIVDDHPAILRGVAASPLPGPSGNVEYFLHLAAGAPPLEEEALARAVADGPQAGLA